MIETMIKRDSTRRLVSAIESLSILSVFNFVETEGYAEVMFRVNDESRSIWMGLIERLVGIHEKISISKKYLLKEGKLAFAWSLSVASNDINKDADEAANLILENISRIQPQSTPIKQPVQLKQKLFQKRQIIKPIYQNPEAGITVWEMELPHASANRNQPKILEDGSVSTKGAFTFSDKGRKEWAKVLSYRTGKGRVG